MKFKKDLLKKCEINLDGSKESNIKLINTIYGAEINDKRIVLAIDAVSISPSISVSSDGDITGLINLNHIEIEDTAKIIKTPEDFAKFVDAHASQAIRYFFVIYMCPLNPQYMSVPICIIPQTTGI